MRARIWPGGLRVRIISWFLVPTVLILLTVALVTYYRSERATEELVMERNQELTRLLAEQLSLALRQHIEPLNNFLLTYPDIFGYDLAAQQALLRQYMGSLAVYDGGVLLVDRDGLVVAADRQPLDVLGQDWSGRSFVRRIQQAPQMIFSDITSLGPGGTHALVVALPVADSAGRFHGLLTGLFRMDAKMSALYRSILELGLYGNADQTSRRVSLVDGAGRAIYDSDLERLGADLSAQPAVQAFLKSRSGTLRTRDAEGQEIVASFAPLPGLGWGLVIEERWAALTAVSQGYQRLLLGLLALGVGLPILVVVLGVRRVTRPLAELTDAAHEVAGGNLNQTIRVDTGDELETLAEQFNRMSAQLQASYAHLEQRVADRTRELATLNAVAAVVSRSLDLEEILSAALTKILETMGFEAGGAFRLSEDGTQLSLIAQRGLSKPFVAQVSQLALSASVAGQAQGPIVRAVSDYPEGALKALLQREGFRQVISVPLLAKGRLLGALNLATRVPRPVTAEELSLLAAVGQQTGVAVENTRLYEAAEQHAVAAERNRLARELHDAVTQTLFSASLIAEVLPLIWERDPDQGRERLVELRELTRGALAEMRTLLLELRPSALMEADLGELLRQLAESVTGRARVPVALQLEGTCAPPPEVKVALYRIAQEALNNVTKHAQASQASIGLWGQPGGIELRISDDGCGFDPTSVPPDHLGVGIMRERIEAVGAHLEIQSGVGRGTQVKVVWRESGCGISEESGPAPVC